MEIIVQIELKKSEEKQISDKGRKRNDQILVEALNTRQNSWALRELLEGAREEIKKQNKKSQLHPYGQPPVPHPIGTNVQMRFWLQLLQ